MDIFRFLIFFFLGTEGLVMSCSSVHFVLSLQLNHPLELDKVPINLLCSSVHHSSLQLVFYNITIYMLHAGYSHYGYNDPWCLCWRTSACSSAFLRKLNFENYLHHIKISVLNCFHLTCPTIVLAKLCIHYNEEQLLMSFNLIPPAIGLTSMNGSDRVTIESRMLIKWLFLA